jgi:hypothetical protein
MNLNWSDLGYNLMQFEFRMILNYNLSKLCL